MKTLKQEQIEKAVEIVVEKVKESLTKLVIEETDEPGCFVARTEEIDIQDLLGEYFKDSIVDDLIYEQEILKKVAEEISSSVQRYTR